VCVGGGARSKNKTRLQGQKGKMEEGIDDKETHQSMNSWTSSAVWKKGTSPTSQKTSPSRSSDGSKSKEDIERDMLDFFLDSSGGGNGEPLIFSLLSVVREERHGRRRGPRWNGAG
jgi:hypothetical protein